MPGIRESSDPVQRSEYFGKKMIAQSRRFLVIERDGLVKLLFGDFEKPYPLHSSYLYFFRTDSNETALRSPRS